MRLKTDRAERLSLWRFLAAAILLLGCWGCGGSDSADVVIDDQPPQDQGFTITAPGVTNNSVTLEVGDTLQFSPENASFSSSDASKATVTSGGLLTAIAPGTTTISATNQQGRSADNNVTVTIIAQRKATEIRLEYSPFAVEAGPNTSIKGLSGTAKAYAIYASEPQRVDVSDRVLRWEKKEGLNPDKLELTAEGVYTANGYEGALAYLVPIGPIFADSDPLSEFNRVALSVAVVPNRGAPLERIEITGAGIVAGTPKTLPVNTASIDLGATGYFNGVATQPGAFDAEVVWKSSAPDVASVDGLGVVTVKRKGTDATITAERLSQPGGELRSDSVKLTIAP